MNPRPYLAMLAFGFAAALALVARAAPAPAEPVAPAASSAAPTNASSRPLEGARPPGSDDGDRLPSAAIFPPQTIPLRFSHARHLHGTGATCATCHARATTSSDARDRLLPEGTACDGCHGTSHASPLDVAPGEGALGACATCHEGWAEGARGRAMRVTLPAPHLRFDHRAHAARNIGCAQCHGGVDRVDLATREQLPRMRGCLVCHGLEGDAQGDAKGGCTTCHLRDDEGRLRTQFESGKLVPPRWMGGVEHGPDFVERHRRVASERASLCASCHTERSCTDCHDGTVRPRRVHPNDWVSMHPVAARTDQPRCSSCHRDQSFCLSCHERAGVAESAGTRSGASFHPAGWAETRGRGPGHHAWEAQRNLTACTSCHTERDCAICHASTARRGLGVDPHPAGFSASCASMMRRNPRPCLVCHEGSSASLARCR